MGPRTTKTPSFSLHLRKKIWYYSHTRAYCVYLLSANFVSLQPISHHAQSFDAWYAVLRQHVSIVDSFFPGPSVSVENLN